MAINPVTDKRLRYDGLETYLQNPLAAGDVSITFKTVLSATGGIGVATLVPPSEHIVLSILDVNYRLAEIVYLTAYSYNGTTGTIERGREGTTAKSHAADVKIVHAPTAYDYFLVVDHKTVPGAHPEVLQAAKDYTDSTMTGHLAATDPHPVYAKKAGDTFTGDVIFSGTTKKVTVQGNLDIPVGASLTVEGELRVTGKFFLNGREVIASNTAPSPPSANAIWFQTYG